jgi:hypothetical protein
MAFMNDMEQKLIARPPGDLLITFLEVFKHPIVDNFQLLFISSIGIDSDPHRLPDIKDVVANRAEQSVSFKCHSIISIRRQPLYKSGLQRQENFLEIVKPAADFSGNFRERRMLTGR